MSVAKNTLRGERVWEIDAYRGYRMLLLLILHLYIVVDEFCIDGYYNIDSHAFVDMLDPLHVWFDWGEDGIIYKSMFTDRILADWTAVGIAGFFIISGICCSFSKNNMNRIIRLFAAGGFISAFSFGIYKLTGEEERFIRFGAIMCYAFCHLIYYAFLEKRSNRCLVILAIPILILGYAMQRNPIYSHVSLLYPLGVREYGVSASEYFPVLPYLGWVLIGVVLGRKYYKEKKSLVPFPAAARLTRPLQWLGRYSGVIFVVHIVIYTVVFYGIGCLFDLF